MVSVDLKFHCKCEVSSYGKKLKSTSNKDGANRFVKSMVLAVLVLLFDDSQDCQELVYGFQISSPSKPIFCQHGRVNTSKTLREIISFFSRTNLPLLKEKRSMLHSIKRLDMHSKSSNYYDYDALYLAKVAKIVQRDYTTLTVKVMLLQWLERHWKGLVGSPARQELFLRKFRSLEKIPPTAAALFQHILWAVCQLAFTWDQRLLKQSECLLIVKWGW